MAGRSPVKTGALKAAPPAVETVDRQLQLVGRAGQDVHADRVDAAVAGLEAGQFHVELQVDRPIRRDRVDVLDTVVLDFRRVEVPTGGSSKDHRPSLLVPMMDSVGVPSPVMSNTSESPGGVGSGRSPLITIGVRMSAGSGRRHVLVGRDVKVSSCWLPLNVAPRGVDIAGEVERAAAHVVRVDIHRHGRARGDGGPRREQGVRAGGQRDGARRRDVFAHRQAAGGGDCDRAIGGDDHTGQQRGQPAQCEIARVVDEHAHRVGSAFQVRDLRLDRFRARPNARRAAQHRVSCGNVGRCGGVAVDDGPAERGHTDSAPARAARGAGRDLPDRRVAVAARGRVDENRHRRRGIVGGGDVRPGVLREAFAPGRVLVGQDADGAAASIDRVACRCRHPT